jgi:O-antigen/teichoic acid export membrane protein
LLAFAFVFAEEMVTLIYTAAYVEAAPVMRVYIVSLAALVVELASITLLLKEGVFAIRLNFLMLTLSVALSWFAAKHIGLSGAAVGSVLAIFVDRLSTLKRIEMRTGIPLRQMQDWRTLGLLMLFAILGATFAWAVTARFVPASGSLSRLLLGAAAMSTVYAAAIVLFRRSLGRPQTDLATKQAA